MKKNQTQANRAYHQRMLGEVEQMLIVSGKPEQVAKAKPVEPLDHEWAARKVRMLIKS